MSRWLRSDRPGADDYDRKFVEAERSGADVHGEASFVASLVGSGATVLDAGCGTGRVAVELAQRGYDVVGADLDPGMLAGARAKAPHLPWFEADLAAADLAAAVAPHRRFDLVVAVGNVMIFLEPGTEGAVVANLAGVLGPGGLLVAGFQLDGRLPVADYDAHCATAGLELAQRWSTWDRQPWTDDAGYAVSVHASRRIDPGLEPPGAAVD